jgi:ureidoglycolate hydrolase
MESVEHRQLTLEPVTHESWAPFGTIPSDEQTDHDTTDLEFLWNDGHVNFIGHINDELTFATDGAAHCELLNRHDTHTQTLMPMSGDAYVVVAPEDHDFSQPDHFEHVRAFYLPQYAVVHLARGTWHWGPYPLDVEQVRIFNIQGRGYAKDNGIAWLARDHDVTYDVSRTRP